MRNISKTCATLSATLIVLGCNASIAKPFHYEPAVVHLSGVLGIERHYGPPNFGETPETDAKEDVAILKLDRAISVIGDKNGDINIQSYNDVRRIQLNDSKQKRLTRFRGRHVSVRGTLFEKETGENYTDVLMNIQEIHVAK